MSLENLTVLNREQLIGFNVKAWHFSPEHQGEEPNHYPGAIPPADVRRRLFHWEAQEGTVSVSVMNNDGVLTIECPDRKAIVRPDTGKVLGMFKAGYLIHQHQSLMDTVQDLVDAPDSDLGVASAGLLKGGAVAYICLELPESIVTPEDVEFRPRLLGAGSHDGSLSSTFKRVVGLPVCDNTLSGCLLENGPTIKVRHSRYSDVKLASVKDALGMMHTLPDDFSQQVAKLTAIKVDSNAWERVLKRLAPIPDLEGPGKTRAENKVLTLRRMWQHDNRVAPWSGTAYGVIQAVNTYVHHEQSVKGDRVERNALKAVNGDIDKLDAGTLKMVLSVVG